MQKNPSQLVSNFFGLKSEEAGIVRHNVFTQVHNIVYHGNGGYDWFTIYNMPIWLRKFTFKEIQDYIENQNKKIQSQNDKSKTSLVNSDGQINTPQFKNASKPYEGKSSY